MADKLEAPESGVTIRMYRPGHGDCFLLAMPRMEGDEPFYVLIDCGLKPGSQNYIHEKTIGQIVEHIGGATDYRLDLVVITHEHQDHVNGFWKENDPYFKDFHIEEAWLAWTEDPADKLANALRERHKDQLLSLVEARHQLALAIGEEDPEVGRLDSFLSLEFGGEDEGFNIEEMRAAATDPTRSKNKQAMKLIKDLANKNKKVRYLSPGWAPVEMEGTAGVRAYVLGPPRAEDLLESEEPVGKEKFPGQASAPQGLSFAAALQQKEKECREPFDKRYRISKNRALRQKFFRNHYGLEGEGDLEKDKTEVADNASWRRIDAEWLYAAESLALKLNSGINNTSLVLAFELPKSRKVLLFTGDAQRGNWISWADDKHEEEARDLLGRTVLYKVGHHGSHNATLDGDLDDHHPNLAWMGVGATKDEFAAMIPAVNAWAMEKNNPPWQHPLPSIKEALLDKAQGRVFQTDENRPAKPDNVEDADWQEFLGRSKFGELYLDYMILDD